MVDLGRQASVTRLRKGLSFLPRAEPPTAPHADEERPAAPDGEHRPEAAAPPAPCERHPVGVAFGHDDDGTWWLRGRRRAEDGALVERALLDARDAVFRDRHGPTDQDGAGNANRAVPNDVRWADAIIRLAHTGLDHLDPATATGRPPSHRYQVIVHFDPARGTTRLHDGPILNGEDAEHVACDAMVRVWCQPPGGPADLGCRARVVDDKLRTVIEHRDQGCVVPGCAQQRWLRIHHVWHWEHGGPTDTWNLVSLCTAHHRAVHDGDIVLRGNPDRGELAVTDTHGRPVGPSPPRPIQGPLDVEHQRYQARTGERADWRWMCWRDPA